MSENIIRMPELCKTHQVLLVRQCGYGPSDPWQALMIATQIALLQGASVDPKVHAQTEGKVENFARLGCMACRKPDTFGLLIDKVQHTERAAHIREIKALGESWVNAAKSNT